MALMYSQICNLNPLQLKNVLADQLRKVRVIDCRSFLEYNDNHIAGAVNICCSKLIKRRLQQEKISLKDLLLHCRIEIEETSDVVVYDQRSSTADEVSPDSFIFVLLKKLVLVFEKVFLLSGGFVDFQSHYPDLCENKVWKYPGLTAFSQPCLPTTSTGPTRILPFLYLGSEEDANNKELLQSHKITYELNVSNKCAKPEFISEGHFLRVPVNDSHNEKLVPFFSQTFQFVEKVRESNESVLIHCLAGISRSPTVAIAYVMRHLQMNCEDAYRYVKAKRATISPNFNFLGQLLEYEKQLISEKILEKKHLSQTVSPYTTSQSSDFLLGPQPMLSPPPTTGKTCAKRLNLSLRLCPYSGSPSLSSPKDASPTTAMARLQFDKPQGKENRTGTCSVGSPTSGVHLGLGMGLGFSLPRPTRLVKEQNVTSIQEEEIGQWESVTKSVTRQSVSISFAKAFKSRKSSVEQYQHQSEQGSSSSGEFNFLDEGANYGNARKCRVHKIAVEGENNRRRGSESLLESPGIDMDALKSSPSASSVGDQSVQSGLLNSPLGFNRNYMRSDSVSTSGIGSEISEHDLLASGSWEMNESGSGQDDGVFSDTYSLYSRSPKPPRQLQLWSSDSGHWSSTDDGASSCFSSSIEVPAIPNAGEAKSPEKRKYPDSLFMSSGQPLTNLEKRRSYAGGGSSSSSNWDCGENSRPKRWSLSEDLADKSASDGQTSRASGGGEKCEDCEEGSGKQSLRLKEYRESQEKENDERSRGSSSSSSSNLNFGHHWFNLLSGRELTCCERQGDGLYRVHSCPGIIGGYRDWIHIHNQVPDSPPEPISDSVLLKMRSCRNRSKHQKSSDQPGSSSLSKNRFSCGNIDHDELWCKLQNVQDSKTDSSHSSSSTLASSSFSIVVQ